MKSTDVFPGKYLRAADLDGREPIVTIDRVTVETLGDESKPVLYFRDKEKGVVLNKTNWVSIVEISGQEDSEDWAGTRVQLVTRRVDFQGKRVEAIRLEAPPRAGRQKPVPAAPPVDPVSDGDLTDDDIPF